MPDPCPPRTEFLSVSLAFLGFSTIVRWPSPGGECWITCVRALWLGRTVDEIKKSYPGRVRYQVVTT